MSPDRPTTPPAGVSDPQPPGLLPPSEEAQVVPDASDVLPDDGRPADDGDPGNAVAVAGGEDDHDEDDAGEVDEGEVDGDVVIGDGDTGDRVDDAGGEGDDDDADDAPGGGTVPDGFRTGMVAIIGRPNVGKSTLLNRLVGQKISITSRKAQTTRHRILGIATTATAQFVFVDTPGFQTRHKSVLHKSMHRAIRDAVAGVSVILFVVESGRFGPEDQAVLQMLPTDTPVILVINKSDALDDKRSLLPYLHARSTEHPWSALVPVSAKTGHQIDDLVAEIEKLLPVAPPLFDADDLTDRSERFLVSEMVREKVFRQLGEELPYGMTVVIDRFVEEPTAHASGVGRFCRIAATIIVERSSHKAMLIGSGGGKLKLIGSEARADIEKLLQARCHLELWVKVKSGWADSAALVKSFGYE